MRGSLILIITVTTKSYDTIIVILFYLGIFPLIFQDGVFDLDYRLRLVDRGGGSISNLEYKTWRGSGNAFEFDSTEGNKETSVEESNEGKTEGEEAEGEKAEEKNMKKPNNSLVSSLVTHKVSKYNSDWYLKITFMNDYPFFDFELVL